MILDIKLFLFVQKGKYEVIVIFQKIAYIIN